MTRAHPSWLSIPAAASALALGFALLAGAAAPALAVPIDTFDDPAASDTLSDATGGGDSAVYGPAPGAVGGERDAAIERLSGSGTVSSDQGAGSATWTVPSGNRGRLEMQWDGGDGSQSFDPAGLGGSDLTAGGARAVRLDLGAVSGLVEILVEVWTDASNASRAFTTVSSPGGVYLTFAGSHPHFQTRLGAGADFTNVGAIKLVLFGGTASTGVSATIDGIETVGSALATPTKVDLDASGLPIASAQPGGDVEYHITITDTGAGSAGLDLSDAIDPETTSSMTLDTTPVAFDDSFASAGNVAISIAAPGVLANDCDPDAATSPSQCDGQGLAATPISASDTASALGGTVSVNAADGSFTYTPPSGIFGVDSFDYTIADGEGGSATATASILLDGLVWFVNNAPAGDPDGDVGCAPPPCGLGTLASPFGDFSSLNGVVANVDRPGDTIFVFEGAGAYDTGGALGLPLEPGQSLIGEGVSLVLGASTVVAGGPTERPTLENLAAGFGAPDVGGDAIGLAADSTLRGLDLGDVPAAGTRLTDGGSGAGTLTIGDVAVGSTGGVLHVTGGGTFDVTFDSITSTASSGAPAVHLNMVGGSLTVLNPGAGADTTISGADAGIAIEDSVGSASFAFGETSVTTDATGGDGINLSSNAAATFTFDSLDVTTGAGDALVAGSSGAINIGGTANTLDATGGAALVVASTSAGAGWTFDTLDSTASPADGVTLQDLSGSSDPQVTVTGATTISGSTGEGIDLDGSGSYTFGTVDVSSSGNDGIEIDGATGAIQFGATTIDSATGSGVDVGTTAVSGSVDFTATLAVDDAAPGIQIQNNEGSFEVAGTTSLGATTGNGSVEILIFDGDGSVTFANVGSDNRGGDGIVVDTTGGTIAFGDVSVDNQASSVAEAVEVRLTTGGSVTFTSISADLNGVASHGISLSSNAATVTIDGGSVENNTGLFDGIHSVNTPLAVDLMAIGANAPIGDDGVEIVNSDGTARAVAITNSNLFPVSGLGIQGVGLRVDSSGTGALTATLTGNQILATGAAIRTTDGGTAGSLVLDLQNSTLTRQSSGFTEEHLGSGLNSTLVRSWSGPNQVIGVSSGDGGILFDRVTFDADANPGNGFQQVLVGGTGTVQIGSGGDNVEGDGLRFTCPTGDLSIPTLNVFNQNGTGLTIHTKAGFCGGTATSFTFATGAGTISTTTGPALDLDPATVNATLTQISSVASPTFGVNIDEIDSSTLTGISIGAGSIMGAAGTAFRVDGGRARIFYGGTITNMQGFAVTIENRPALASDVDFGGTITDNVPGVSQGIRIANNLSGAFHFNDPVTLDTGSNTALTLVGNTLNDTLIRFTDGLDIDTTSGNGIDVSGGSDLDIDDLGAPFNPSTITTTSGRGFEADGGGTLEVTGEARITSGSGVAVDIQNTTIGAAGVTFESVSKNSVTGPGIRLVSTGSGPFTITGDGTAAGSGGNGSGGTIENIVGSDAVVLDGTGGLVTLQNMVIEDISAANDSGGSADPVGTRTNVDGIHGQNVTGGLKLESVTMRRFSDNAINGSLFADGISETDFTGLEIRGSILQNSNRYHVGLEELTSSDTDRGDDSAEAMVRIIGLDGTVNVIGSLFERGAQFLEFRTPTSGQLTLTVQDNTFTKTHKEFKCLPGDMPAALPVNVGKAGIFVLVRGSTDADVFIGSDSNAALGNTFTDNMTASIILQHDSATSGEIDTEISNNQFIVNDHLAGPGPFPNPADECAEGSLFITGTLNHPQGGVLLGPGGGAFEGRISKNLFDEVGRAEGGPGQLTLVADDGGSSEFIVQGNNFMLPWEAGVRMQVEDSGTTSAILFGGPGASDDNTYTDGTVGETGDPNDDVGFATPSPFTPFQVNVRTGATLDLKVQNEILHQHDDVSSGFPHSFDASINSTGGTLNLHLDDSRSPDGYNLDHGGGTFNLFSETGCVGSPSAQTILDNNGNTGGGNNDLTDPPTVSTSGTITCSTTPPTPPSLVIP